jgi:hypothetical protein
MGRTLLDLPKQTQPAVQLYSSVKLWVTNKRNHWFANRPKPRPIYNRLSERLLAGCGAGPFGERPFIAHSSAGSPASGVLARRLASSRSVEDRRQPPRPSWRQSLPPLAP